MKLIISGRLPGLNEYTKACRSKKGWQAGAGLKARTEAGIIKEIQKQLGDRTMEGKIKIIFTWVEPNNLRDLDNVCFAKKFILDALVKAGTLKDDDRKHVEGFLDKFATDKDNPRIEVEFIEVKNENTQRI